jgi:DNA polymerase III delta prime subunit
MGMSESATGSADRDEIWIEKYRPETLADVVGHENIVGRLESYVAQNDLPHLLFSGPAGVGKTTSAMAIAREEYGDDWRENFLELNASDERGIDVVRDRIKDFARTSFGGYDYRIIFLDEADALCVPASTEVVTGYPSSPNVKQIDDVSSDGEPIPSVDFETNELQSDSGQLLETGEADFYEVTLADGRSFLASPRHPFFVVGDDHRLVETQLRDLTPGDEIADFNEDAGVTRCESCNEWTANARFCSRTCKNRGHSREMAGEDNPRSGKVAWNQGLTKADDERVAAQANPGAANGNFDGEFHRISIHEMDEERKREWRKRIRESRLGTTLSKDHRDAIARSVQRNRHGNEVDEEYESKNYRHVVPDEDEVPCEVCGEWYPTEGSDGIYVHHIDGNREHNDPENLLLVCPRCHNMECHDAEGRFLEPGWEANARRPSPETDGGRRRVETATVESVEFDHNGPAYNITMEGTPNFMLANGILTHNTSDAQSALRRTMEQFANNTRFILSCNYSSQIIDPIQSRCAVFRFGPLAEEAVGEYTRQVAEREGIEVTDGGVDALVYAADGDMRKALNGLQAAATTEGAVDDEAVYAITATARPEAIEAMVESALDGDFTAARAKLDDLLTDAGLGGGDVIDQLHRSAWEFDLDDAATVRLLERVGETDYRITQGANERLQLEALLASLALEAE